MKYCKFCGSKLFDEAVKCPYCKRSLMPAIPTFTVRIERESQFFIGNPAIKLNVDGRQFFEINSGETIDVVLPQGRHTFYFSFSIRSKTVNVDLNSNMKLLIGGDRFSGGISVFEQRY